MKNTEIKTESPKQESNTVISPQNSLSDKQRAEFRLNLDYQIYWLYLRG